jgi:CelD/BcsL family acetyltransferase involved in cellulose biosynthesis
MLFATRIARSWITWACRCFVRNVSGTAIRLSLLDVYTHVGEQGRCAIYGAIGRNFAPKCGQKRRRLRIGAKCAHSGCLISRVQSKRWRIGARRSNEGEDQVSVAMRPNRI